MALDGFDWARARDATPASPLRILTSACLVGRSVGWEGGPYTEDVVVKLTCLPNVMAVSFCPEDSTLGTPRPLTTLHHGNGRDALHDRARVFESTGRDVTAQIIQGAENMLAAALEADVELAVLMDVSDSCGTNAIYLGPAEDKRYQKGPGVAAALLIDEGIPVVAQRDYLTLHRLIATLDPTHRVPEDAFDFVDHEWYRSYFAEGSES
jgi:uncharacterized protein YbbK (DUF523 family)